MKKKELLNEVTSLINGETESTINKIDSLGQEFYIRMFKINFSHIILYSVFLILSLLKGIVFFLSRTNVTPFLATSRLSFTLHRSRVTTSAMYITMNLPRHTVLVSSTTSRISVPSW